MKQLLEAAGYRQDNWTIQRSTVWIGFKHCGMVTYPKVNTSVKGADPYHRMPIGGSVIAYDWWTFPNTDVHKLRLTFTSQGYARRDQFRFETQMLQCANELSRSHHNRISWPIA